MKVFVVTHGEYSDYRIDAVCSSPEKAKEFMGTSKQEFGVEEYEVDGEQSRVWGTVWVVLLRLDGSISSEWEREEDVSEHHYKGDRGQGQTAAGFYDNRRTAEDGLTHGWFQGTSYVSRDHALKLAAEQRQKALAEHPEYFK